MGIFKNSIHNNSILIMSAMYITIIIKVNFCIPCKEMMQVKVPKETVRHHSTSINVVHPSLDYNDIRHPLELSSSVEEHLTDCDPQQGSQYQELSSSFSKPIVINVQTKEDEGKGVEVR